MDDLAVPQHHRSGAHRVRRHPVLVAAATVGAVAVACAVLLWALLSSDVLGVGDDLREAGGVAPAAPADPSADASAPSEPSAGPSAGSPSAGASAPAGDGPALTVLNATTTSGLATEAAEVLEEAGWTVDEVGNYGGEDGPSAVLWPEDDPAAESVAALVAVDLGTGEPVASDDVDTVTVVVGEDFRP
ncbi:LytR C-terminal domain-containing protein [Aquipuribacter hungaricus]